MRPGPLSKSLAICARPRSASRRPSRPPSRLRNRKGEHYDRQKAHVDQSRRLAGRVVGRRLQRSSRQAPAQKLRQEARSRFYQVGVGGELASGVHTPDSKSVTVAEAGRLWLESCEAAGLERATMAPYRQHLNLHIVPLIGAVKLSRLTAPMARAFEDRLRLDRSPA